MNDLNKKEKIKWLVLIQFLVLLYSFISVLTKVASKTVENGIFSWQFIGNIALIFVVLGIYAILWQKVLAHIGLSVAYSNKGVCLFWGMIWSVLFFNETIKWNNIVGVLIMFCGILLLNSKEKEEADE